VLCLENTEFFARDAAVVGIRGPVFAHTDDLTIKLEGARHRGARKISVVRIDAAAVATLPEQYCVYGRNGVEVAPVSLPDEREIGILIETRAERAQDAETLASVLTHYLIHYGYPGRKATAGNVAYPISPNVVSFRRDDGSFGALVVQGTRDPVFQERYAEIVEAVQKLVADEFHAREAPPGRTRRAGRAGRRAAGFADRARRPGLLRMEPVPPVRQPGRHRERPVPHPVLRRRRGRLGLRPGGAAALLRHRRS
jgi:hypothetical protein